MLRTAQTNTPIWKTMLFFFAPGLQRSRAKNVVYFVIGLLAFVGVLIPAIIVTAPAAMAVLDTLLIVLFVLACGHFRFAVLPRPIDAFEMDPFTRNRAVSDLSEDDFGPFGVPDVDPIMMQRMAADPGYFDREMARMNAQMQANNVLLQQRVRAREVLEREAASIARMQGAGQSVIQRLPMVINSGDPQAIAAIRVEVAGLVHLGLNPEGLLVIDQHLIMIQHLKQAEAEAAPCLAELQRLHQAGETAGVEELTRALTRCVARADEVRIAYESLPPLPTEESLANSARPAARPA